MIGVEIGPDALRGACYDRYENGCAPLRTAEVPLPAQQGDDEAISQAIRLLLERLDSGKAPITVAIPSEWCYFRTVSLPYRKTSRVEGTLAYALEGRLPGGIEQYVVEPITELLPAGDHGARVHTAACSSERLDWILKAFHLAGVDPCVLQPVAVSLCRGATGVAARESGGAALLIRINGGVCNLVWTAEGDPLACQSISVRRVGSMESVNPTEVAEKIRFAVCAQEVSHGGMDCRNVLLLAPEDEQEDLADAIGMALDIPVSILPDDSAWAGVAGVVGDAAKRKQFAVSLRRGSYQYPPYARRRDRRIGAALLLAAAIVLALSLSSLKSHLDAEKEIRWSIEQQELIAREFGRSDAMSPQAMAALVTQIETEANQSGQAAVRSCLHIWVNLMSQIREHTDVVLETIDIKQGGISLKAVAPNSTEAWKFRRTLQASHTFRADGQFSPKPKQGGGVSFTMNLEY